MKDDDENDNLEYSFTLNFLSSLSSFAFYIYIYIFVCVSPKDVIAFVAFRKSDVNEDEHTSHFMNIRKMLEYLSIALTIR
jgi:hypothetical protein